MLLFVLFVTVALGATSPMQRFVQAVQRNDEAVARDLRPAIQEALATEHQLRLSLPAGQQLRWQLRKDPEALGRLQQLCQLYVAEAAGVVRGFMQREARVEHFFTNKLVALYHMRALVQESKKLSPQQKDALLQEIAAVGTHDGPHVEALRQRLESVYTGH